MSDIYDEAISALATDFEDMIVKDNPMLDLTELDMETKYVHWILKESFARNLQMKETCMNCRHLDGETFTSRSRAMCYEGTLDYRILVPFNHYCNKFSYETTTE